MRSFIVAALVGSALASPVASKDGESPAACAQRCTKEWEACKTKPNANQSLCGSDYGNCLGFAPFAGEPKEFHTPTACSVTSAPTGYAPPTAYDTPPAYPTPSAVQDECAKKCTEEWEACKNKPNANQSLCGSDYGNCLGYAPFQGEYHLPTACSKTAEPTTTAIHSMDACAKKCFEEYDACRTKPGANQSVCGSDYGNCLGFAPFTGANATIPTACSKPVEATPCPTETAHAQDDCAKKCVAEWDACKVKYLANQSLCGSDFANCLGYTPFINGVYQPPTTCHNDESGSPTGGAPTGDSPTGGAPPAGGKPTGVAPHQTPVPTAPAQPPVATGAAGHFQPAQALLALGALALL